MFASNPAACPAGASVGRAIVHTPMLPEAMAGPLYFVSNGDVEVPRSR